MFRMKINLMKKCIVVFCCLFLVSCTPKQEDSSSSPSSSGGSNSSVAADVESIISESESSEEQSSTVKTDSSQPQTSSKVPSNVSFDPLPDDKKLGYDINSIVGVDQFGRTFSTISSTDSKKQVGMFFWLWIGQPQYEKTYDTEKILSSSKNKQETYDLLFHTNNDTYPAEVPYFYYEPIWGYYNSADDYVIRRQMEMLTVAGIDYIAFDVSNGTTYRSVYLKFMRIIEELVNEGWNPPRVTFYTHGHSTNTLRNLYSEVYSRKLYSKSWYYVDGKPFIIAYSDVDDDIYENGGTINPEPLSKEILNFFTFKRPQWPTTTTEDIRFYNDGVPWVEWIYPQPLHGDTISVSVASHPAIPMSFSLTRGALNWGRGWDPITKKNVAENVYKGTFFQLQWDNAIKANPKNIFVGGWNELIAYKTPYAGEYMFCDGLNVEFSRDIEPMNGGFEDAFYQQLIKNVRKYKSTSGTAKGTKKSINLAAGTDQWSSVKNVYRSIGTENYGRDYKGANKDNYYKQDAPRNNIQEVRVANDNDYVYFYIRCENAITSYTSGTNWMNVLIGSGTPDLSGWNGYEYVLNREPGKNGTTSIHKLDSAGKATKVGSAEYTVNGSVMQVKVAKNSIGLKGEKSLYFKVADGVTKSNDIMNYYVTGKSLPLGRLSYQYNLG